MTIEDAVQMRQPRKTTSIGCNPETSHRKVFLNFEALASCGVEVPVVGSSMTRFRKALKRNQEHRALSSPIIILSLFMIAADFMYYRHEHVILASVCLATADSVQVSVIQFSS